MHGCIQKRDISLLIQYFTVFLKDKMNDLYSEQNTGTYCRKLTQELKNFLYPPLH
jgi:hypothetical protein